MAKRQPFINRCVDEFRYRLSEDWQWFPLPALLSFGLVALLTSHLLPGLNPRLGQPAKVLEFEAEREQDGSIWMAVSIDASKNEMVISTADRRVLRFQSDVSDMEDFAPLVEHLQAQVRRRLRTAALARHLSTTEITAVVAVDETVKFGLVRPIINAMALAGITDYAFETVLTREL